VCECDDGEKSEYLLGNVVADTLSQGTPPRRHFAGGNMKHTRGKLITKLKEIFSIRRL
jgi:hypothetical protein